MILETSWATAVSKNESSGTAIIYRYIQKFDVVKTMSRHKFRVIVTWEYSSQNGMPDAANQQLMDSFENALEKHMAEGDFSTLAIVSTGDNLREWTYYSASEAEFFTRFNDALVGKERFPVKLHAAMDDEWSTYNDFLKTIA
jgi:Family of unknown function (DUF695)